MSSPTRSSRSRGLAGLLCAALALGAASAPDTAAAQPAKPKDDVDAVYKQHMTNGVKLYQDKNFEAAIVEFEAAYKAKPKASPLVNIALCRKGLFQYPKAIKVLEEALDKQADTLTPADKKAAEDAIAELRSLIGFVTVKLTPDTATLLLDDEPQPKDTAKKPIPLGPGTHKLTARAEGYAEGEQTVTVASGEKDKTVTLTLVPDKGYVTIKADDPKKAIAIDQKAMGYGSWSGFISPGTHLVQMYQPGGGAGYSVQVVVAAGKAQEVREGVGGSAVMIGPGGAVQTPEKPPEKPSPPVKGFYGLATGTVYGVTTDPTNGSSANEKKDPGLAFGGRVGYRFTTVIGLELMFQYGAAGGSGEVQGTDSKNQLQVGNKDYSMASVRVGPNLRFMTKGKTIRFVGTVGAGLAYDDTSFTDCGFCKAVDGGGLGFYVLLEPGLEVDFSGFIIGAALPIMPVFGNVQGGGDGGSLLQAGLMLRLGYGFWQSPAAPAAPTNPAKSARRPVSPVDRIPLF